jgi:polysaccharide pyruvyl transferase WcaK-like protein
VDYATHEEGEAAKGIPDQQAEALVRLLEAHDISMLLVPHVINPSLRVDDDYRYLAGVRNRMGDKFASRVRLLPADLGARRTKWIIAQCEALVAARMHCAIAGLSTAVPTLLLSYSRKALGMCDYAYGNQDWVLPVSCETARLVSGVERLLGHVEELRRHLTERSEAMREDALRAGAFLRDVLS